MAKREEKDTANEEGDILASEIIFEKTSASLSSD